uniref:Uncharacterized protein n=1 Tax=Triticum urartu TaxID=4572 RepID=A0A8R7UZK0_TRIUA
MVRSVLHLETGQLVGEHLAELRHALWLQRQREREGAVLAGRVHHVHEAAVVHERGPHERRRAPPEVGVGERHAHPADGAQVRARDAASWQVHHVHAVQVVHQRPRMVVPLARRRARAPSSKVHRVRHHLPDGGHGRRPDHRIPEVAPRERRRQARAHVDHGVEPRLRVQRQAPRAARALPHQRHHGAERGRACAPRPQRAHLLLAHRDQGARVRGPSGCRVHRGWLRLVLGVVVRHRALLARGEQPVVEARRHGRVIFGGAAGDARPGLHEERRAPGVDDGVVHRQAEHDTAAAQVRDLRQQQDARRVRCGRRGHEQVAHLAARHELVHEVLERVVIRARGDEDRALAGAVDLDTPGAVQPEAAGQRVERHQSPGEAVLDGVGREEARMLAVRPVEVDRGRVAPARSQVQVGQPDSAPRRCLHRDDHLRRQHLDGCHCVPRVRTCLLL